MKTNRTVDELLVALGEEIQKLRLNRNLSQAALAERAGISLRSLQSLESGDGSTLKTFVAVARALDRVDWLGRFAPIPTINPLTLPLTGQRRQRATPSNRKATRIG